MKKINVIKFTDKGLILLDQRALPLKERYVIVNSLTDAVNAIKDMVVRGAPAIGIAAAYGYCLGFDNKKFSKREDMFLRMGEVKKKLLSSRPTAVNLKWALDRMEECLMENKDKEKEKIFNMLKGKADSIMTAQVEADIKMGSYGTELLKKLKKEKLNILTHCNAGALATGGHGTALGVISSAHESGLLKMLYLDETRPRLQGAKLSCYEMVRKKIPHTLICDSAAAFLMKDAKIDAVITGADRIALNGDAANKIGTYSLSLAAKKHKIPFYIAAPLSTFDFSASSGNDIQIEYRDEREVSEIMGKRIAPEETAVLNPAFDVTPAEFIDAYITEKGVFADVPELQ